MRRRSGPEEIIHRAVVAHLRARCMPGVVWFHPGNGGYRTKAEAGIFKALGVRAGVHDLCFVVPPHGRFFSLELKAKNNTLTTEQRAFAGDVLAAGGAWEWADSLDLALAALERRGILRPNKADVEEVHITVRTA